MKKAMTKKAMQMIRESNEFGIDDRLTALLRGNEELSEDELQLVAAAASPNYEKFRHMIDQKK